MSSTNISSTDAFKTSDLRITFTIIYTLIMIITLVECTLVLILFYMERKNRKIAHNFVISMCLGDIMHGGVGSAVVIHYCNGLKLGDATCHIETAIMMGTAYISLYNLLATSIDRYLSINFPLKYRVYMTNEISYIIIVSAWILGILIGMGIIFLRSDKYLEYPDEMCLYLTLVLDQVYLFSYVQLLLYLGVIVTVFFYILVYIELKRVFETNMGRTTILSILEWVREKKNPVKITGKTETRQIGFLKLREVRVTLIMFVTMFTFVLCWIPVLLVVMAFRNDPNFGNTGILVTYALPKIYSMINPIFYAFTIKNVRTAFKRLTKKQKPQMSLSIPLSSQ